MNPIVTCKNPVYGQPGIELYKPKAHRKLRLERMDLRAAMVRAPHYRAFTAEAKLVHLRDFSTVST